MHIGLLAGQVDGGVRGARRRHWQHERCAPGREGERRAPFEGDGERAWFDDEAPSMTIDDILSSSGVSHFDLLGEPHSANGPSFWLGSRTNDCTEQSSEDIDNAALIGDIWE